ncbi:hypothetical protein RJ639_035743 [Escallonia herrerae]|uniref:Integrase catalytic domain-containing protein n=1 Tax=Escallonia herrerae TaxID=1293975 RepID=A0AA89BBI2_9ASTE|nr:hypothetical protein RJ639_035743 [Escallonia herrerae]
MKALEKLYKKSSASNKVFVMKKLFNMRMSENGYVVDHLNDFNGVTNQLEFVSINFDDESRAMLFLCSLPDSWNNLVTTVSNSTISGMLTLNDVVSSVMNDEMRRKTISDGISSSTALSVESRGHKKNDCMEPKKKKGAGGRQGNDEGANMVPRTPHRDCFCDYVHGDYGHVTVGNGYRCSIVGKGKMEIKLSNGRTLVLKDVRHIPELQKNLISISTRVVSMESKSSFRRDGKEKKIERLELVHTDVCGPTMIMSLGGNFYFISFIDDASRKTWVYAIREKSDVYHTFKKWKALVENETGNKIKCLKSDNGGEYRDGGFQKFCSNNGIRLIRTVKRTPQENGLAERMNITIMKRARYMRILANLPLQFWAAAVDNVDYEHNKIIRSRDVIFDKSRLYKHRLLEHGIKKENKEYMELDELEDRQVPRTENPEVLDETTDTELELVINNSDSGEPKCYQEAIQDESRLQWEQAMKDEMASLEQNQTWDLVKLSTSRVFATFLESKQAENGRKSTAIYIKAAFNHLIFINSLDISRLSGAVMSIEALAMAGVNYLEYGVDNDAWMGCGHEQPPPQPVEEQKLSTRVEKKSNAGLVLHEEEQMKAKLRKWVKRVVQAQQRQLFYSARKGCIEI